MKTPLLQRDIEAFFDAENDIREGRYNLTPQVLTDALITFHREATKAGATGDTYRQLLGEFTNSLHLTKRSTQAKAGPIANGIAVRAAMQAGILETADVDAMPPWKVTQLATEILEAIKAAYEIPKK